MKDSSIEWTHHTFNPWWGCTKVSDGCKHCYAETHSKRFALLLRKAGLIPLLLGAVVALSSTACAHTMVIETDPPGATIMLEGKEVGAAPVVTNERTGVNSTVRVAAKLDNYEEAHVVVTASEWFFWPGLVALVPLMGVPFVVIPFVGPFITVGWALVTSPTLLSLLLIRKYPDRILIRLKPRTSGGMPLPTDTWLIPDDYDPNPPPLGGALPPQPEGANPLPVSP